MEIIEASRKIQNDLVRWRRDLHQRAEIGLKLPETSSYLHIQLKELGIEHKMNIGGSGLVGLISGKTNEVGPTIAIRADMDALPIQEDTNLTFASVNGNMHACGHDAHMAIALGAAKLLNDMRSEIVGNIKFIFQPGEEGYGGAQLMVNEGVLENPTVNAIIGLHVTNNLPELKTNNVGVCYGPLLASSDRFRVTIKGAGCHGATPEKGIDPIVAAVQCIVMLQNIISREIGMSDKAVLSVTSIHGGGSALNVIPESVEFGGTIRCRNVKSREYLFHRIEEVISGTVGALRAGYELIFEKGSPPLINDEFLTRLSAGTAEQVVGRERVVELSTPIMAADDMAVYLQQVPGTYIHLGCGKSGYENYHLHNPHFELDEDILCVGSALLAQTALDALHAIKYETSI